MYITFSNFRFISGGFLSPYSGQSARRIERNKSGPNLQRIIQRRPKFRQASISSDSFFESQWVFDRVSLFHKNPRRNSKNTSLHSTTSGARGSPNPRCQRMATNCISDRQNPFLDFFRGYSCVVVVFFSHCSFAQTRITVYVNGSEQCFH